MRKENDREKAFTFNTDSNYAIQRQQRQNALKAYERHTIKCGKHVSFIMDDMPKTPNNISLAIARTAVSPREIPMRIRICELICGFLLFCLFSISYRFTCVMSLTFRSANVTERALDAVK